MRHIWEGGMTYYRPPVPHLGGRVPPVPRGIYAPVSSLYVSRSLPLTTLITNPSLKAEI